MSIRVLLVDDQPIVRSGIALLLAGEPDIEVVAEVGDGAAAVTVAEAGLPDVVVMDVRMPVMDGVEATRRIVAAVGGSVRVLVLTTFHIDEAVYDALRAGASGFLLKDAAPADLAAAVRAVARGQAWLDPAVAVRLIAEFARRPDPRRPVPTEVALLTGREREVLRLVAHGLSNLEIAAHLVLAEGTVKTHINRMFAKLGLRDRAQAVALAFRTGLVLPGDSAAGSGTS